MNNFQATLRDETAVEPFDPVRSLSSAPASAPSERYDTADRGRTFQGLAVCLVTRCANTPPVRIDAALGEMLEAVGEALALDCCVAYGPDGDGGLRVRSMWARGAQAKSMEHVDAGDALPWTMATLRGGMAVVADTLASLPNPIDRESMKRLGAASLVALPLGSGEADGAFVVTVGQTRTWLPDIVDGLRLVAAVIGLALARQHDRERFGSELEHSRQQQVTLSTEEVIFRRDSRATQPDRTIAVESALVRRVLDQVRQVAPTTATVLLLGETGVGKEVFAHAIHDASPRHRHAMIKVSCAAIPSALLESEMFGRERGAFTGAVSRQVGRFEAANGSTIFLDEIGDLPLDMQVKLLRVLQERTIERLGGNTSTRVDVRIIAATNRDLEAAVANGAFREDLFYRLNVFPVEIPPLRERMEDIPSLVWTFVDEFSRAFGKTIDAVSKGSLAALQRYHWPGNVRELRNVIEREVIVATGPTLTISSPRRLSSCRPWGSTKLADVEVEHIRRMLEESGWRVRGKGGAAERLGMKPTTLESRLARLGIMRDRRIAKTA